MLAQAGIGEFFSQSQSIIVNESDYQKAIESATEPLREYRIAIARALVAQSAILVRDKYGEFALSVSTHWPLPTRLWLPSTLPYWLVCRRLGAHQNVCMLHTASDWQPQFQSGCLR